MGCLLADGTYNESALWFSDTMNKLDKSPYTVPWLYRNEFSLTPASGQHFFLRTGGVTSRADVYLNGQQVADKLTQAGAYGGKAYDITKYISQNNALVLKAYPTNYLLDLAQGFVDWNPYPADNGTGVWRNIYVHQTGAVALSSFRTTTDFKVDGGAGKVTLKATVQNLESSPVSVTVAGSVALDSGDGATNTTQTVTLSPGQGSEVTLTLTVDKPAVWWPKQWGSQPLYKATISASVNGAISDTATKQFGFRTVTSALNPSGDVLFTVNGKPFQVLGGGYTSDMFVRWDSDKFTTMAKYVLDMGHNTIRLEGKMEQPELYEIADRLGLMVMAGWECCDKWEAWPYNDNDVIGRPIPLWSDNDYATANASMRHEALQMQSHPSMLAFLVGSDFWPDDKATAIYLAAMKDAGWELPVVSYAATKENGYPKALGPSGMKMEGPYDWVPPNYWYDNEPATAGSRYGAAFGFGSEQSPGGGTPELGSLRRFLSQADLDSLWRSPQKAQYHQSTSASVFNTRKIFNAALTGRLGAASSLEDYVQKAQIMDYEAARAEYEGFAAMWNAKRPATGLIYWMLNGAWPSLHWQLFDYYLHPAGAYYGAKAGSRVETAAYDYVRKAVWLINRSLDRGGARTLRVEAVGADGASLVNTTASVTSTPNTSKNVAAVVGLTVRDVAFLRLTLLDDKGATISRNVYWLAPAVDTLNWARSDWYYTPVSKYADYKALNKLAAATVTATATPGGNGTAKVTLENKSAVPAFFVSLNLVDKSGEDANPVWWSENYVTLFPQEKMELEVAQYGGTKGTAVQIVGKNVAKTTVTL
jgi:exo-1,4-beta-D-glucosaminidase